MLELKNNSSIFRLSAAYNRFIGAVPGTVLLLLALLYHILLGLQGVDMLDEGFHASLYQQFFNDPVSVQYTFLYWLSGLFGALWLKLFPFAGWLGIRIFGALTCTTTLFLAYRLLKDKVAPVPLRTSLILLALFINNDPKDFYYNNFSALLYFAAAALLIRGLVTKRNLLVFLAAALIGINIFNRLPNLLGTGMVLLILYYDWMEKQAIRSSSIKVLVFGAGVISGILFILGLMKALGHIGIFQNALAQLFTISTAQKANDGLKGSYGPFNLLFQSARQYANSLTWVINSAVLLLVLAYALQQAYRFPEKLKRLVQAGIWLIAAVFAVTLIKDGILNLKLIELFTGLALTGSLWVMLAPGTSEKKLVAAAGLFIVLVHPFGSAVGIYTVVPYSLWISFPLFAGQFSLLGDLTLGIQQNGSEKNGTLLKLDIPNSRMVLIRYAGTSVLLLGCLLHIVKYPYFYDRHNRWEMQSTLVADNYKGIFTSAPKAKLINELLKESEKYIKPGDTVLAYDLIPMYHYWTATKPYLKNPCPWFYSTSLFAEQMDLAEQTNPVLPVVVIQKIRTIGDGSGWPEVQLTENYQLEERNKGRNERLSEFLVAHQYKTIWENSVFEIHIPPAKK